jgi:hypothetical protein
MIKRDVDQICIYDFKASTHTAFNKRGPPWWQRVSEVISDIVGRILMKKRGGRRRRECGHIPAEGSHTVLGNYCYIGRCA